MSASDPSVSGVTPAASNLRRMCATFWQAYVSDFLSRRNCSAARLRRGMVSASRSNMNGCDSSDTAFPLYGSQLRRLRFQALDGLCLVDHEAHMGAGADGIDLVLCGHRESHLAALDRSHGGGDLDRRPRQGGGKMLDRHFHADRILVRLGMFQDEVAAGEFDVAKQVRRRVDPPFLAHEKDRLLFSDRDSAYQAKSRLQTPFHSI